MAVAPSQLATVVRRAFEQIESIISSPQLFTPSQCWPVDERDGPDRHHPRITVRPHRLGSLERQSKGPRPRPPRSAFRLSEATEAAGISRLLAGGLGKREYSRQIGSHPGNSGLDSIH
jgi:hypothetical protein